jgi:uncharacterized protein with PIN domain
LAKWLRALGFDAAYDPFLADHGVIATARERGAIALTRDTRFPRPADVCVLFVEDDRVEQQLGQVVRDAGVDLAEARPMSRCTVCNDALVRAHRSEVWERVPPFIYLNHERYARCPSCARVYWEGSHALRIRRQLDMLVQQAARERT